MTRFHFNQMIRLKEPESSSVLLQYFCSLTPGDERFASVVCWLRLSSDAVPLPCLTEFTVKFGKSTAEAQMSESKIELSTAKQVSTARSAVL